MLFWWICGGESVLPVLLLRHLGSSPVSLCIICSLFHFCFLCFPWTDFYDFVFHCWVFSSSSMFFLIHILVPFKIQNSILNLLLSTFKYVTSVLWKDLKIVYFHFFVIFVGLCKNEKSSYFIFNTYLVFLVVFLCVDKNFCLSFFFRLKNLF